MSASSAELMDALQGNTLKALKDAGVNEEVAKAAAGGVAALTAAGIGAAVSGTAGSMTAVTVDANNRQLHPNETKWIRDNAKRFAKQQGISDQEADQRLAQQAFRQVQFGAVGVEDAQARAFLSQGHGMLPVDPTCPTCGPGYMFYATPEQRANATMYAGMLGKTSGFYQANGLTHPTLQQIVNAAMHDSAQRNVVAQRTVLAAAAAVTLTLAPALSGAAAEVAAFAKNPVGYCLGNPAGCMVAGETAAYTAAGVPQPASGVPTKVVTATANSGGGLGKITGNFSAIEPGPLATKYAETFAGGRYATVTLQNETVLYRAGTAGNPLGEYFTLEPPTGVLQTRIDKAVLPEWPSGAKSPIDTSFAIRIPAGTQVHVGQVGAQRGFYVGGTQQIVIPKPWTIKGVQVINSSPLK